MPHTINIVGEPPIAQVTADGSIDVSYWRWLLFDAVRQAESRSVSLILIDLRTTSLNTDPGRLIEVGDTVHRHLDPAMRLAAVVTTDGRSPGWHALVESESVGPVHFFDSEEDARGWLRGGAHEAAA